MVLDWAIAAERLPGETASGDRGVVIEFTGGALVAVIDGLGHGDDAAVAARAAERVLLEAPAEPIVEIVERCHRELRGTRGVVMTIASFDVSASTVSWLGVGNVEALIVRADAAHRPETVMMRGGTIGYKLPPLAPRTLDVAAGDTLVMATDGIRTGFRSEIVAGRSPREIADTVVATWATKADDACVVVARYTGTEVAA